MSKKCTCPSGDGSLRWPCPTHVTLPMPAEPVAWKWRRHALERWVCVGFWDSIEEVAAIEMEGREWEVARLYTAPQATFQQRVQPWMLECFGAEISADRNERNHRFLEEAVELVQATGCTASEVHQLVDYVYGRPVGEPAQEVGGVMVTLAALCLANGLDMHQAGETELARIWTKVEAIRAKQAAKPKHSPLPEASKFADGLMVNMTPPATSRDRWMYEQGRLAEQERICSAIKAEDDYCVNEGNYMLDSEDCIKVARGSWVRPVYDKAQAQEGHSHG